MNILIDFCNTAGVKMLPFVIIFLISVNGGGSREFSTCELVQELRRQHFPENQLEDWTCLIWAESSARTDVVGGPDGDGSYDFGLFQINDRYWCSTTTIAGKGCNVLCSDLLQDDITKATECAKKIYRKHGFKAWVGWVNACKGKNLKRFHC
ncbi:hypothetical protein K1T71_006688 [Dendrolimus kikuchii]|uniref:Uncharacterized protein n=1 Tax=Dendrolimus kikuchii TaxID=765133 RepID=A0ACC1D258_9NEOP|nr:hypothetical protein K1T71_006688 [Dendrolimus kikuchii]